MIASLILALAAQPGLRGTEPAVVRTIIDDAVARLNKGEKADAILTDPKYDDARSHRRFRQALAAHPGRGVVSMVTPHEPGERLEFKMILKSASGQPVRDAFIYLYHTDIHGLYFKGNEDASPPDKSRLFVYGLTGDDGTLTIKTIRPAGYPGTDIPQHIHFHVERPSGFVLNEVFFDDDPRLTSDMRSQSSLYATIIKPVKKNGVWQASVEIWPRS